MTEHAELIDPKFPSRLDFDEDKAYRDAIREHDRTVRANEATRAQRAQEILKADEEALNPFSALDTVKNVKAADRVDTLVPATAPDAGVPVNPKLGLLDTRKAAADIGVFRAENAIGGELTDDQVRGQMIDEDLERLFDRNHARHVRGIGE